MITKFKILAEKVMWRGTLYMLLNDNQHSAVKAYLVLFRNHPYEFLCIGVDSAGNFISYTDTYDLAEGHQISYSMNEKEFPQFKSFDRFFNRLLILMNPANKSVWLKNLFRFVWDSIDVEYDESYARKLVRQLLEE